MERGAYVHHAQLVRNRHMYYEKMDIYLIEIEKFFAIEDRTPPEERELSDKAEMLPNILYEKQGSYLQGQEDMVKAMLAEGVSVDIVMRVSKFSEKKSSSCRPRSLGKKQPLKGEPLEPRYDYRCDDCRE